MKLGQCAQLGDGSKPAKGHVWASLEPVVGQVFGLGVDQVQGVSVTTDRRRVRCAPVGERAVQSDECAPFDWHRHKIGRSAKARD